MANAHERFMQIAMEEARRGAAEGNVAVGSVVVHDEDMVARGRNLVATESDPTAHAETVALRNFGESESVDGLPGCLPRLRRSPRLGA